MASDPPDKFSSNRVSVLGDYIESRPKKQKYTDYLELPTPQNSNNNNNPKYVVISITTLRDVNLLTFTRNIVLPIYL